MRYLIITEEAIIVEVTNLYDKDSREITNPLEATSCVLKFDDEHWAAVAADGPIHVVN